MVKVRAKAAPVSIGACCASFGAGVVVAACLPNCALAVIVAALLILCGTLFCKTC